MFGYSLPVKLHYPPEASSMAHELDPKEPVDFREMVLDNTIQITS